MIKNGFVSKLIKMTKETAQELIDISEDEDELDMEGDDD